MRGMAVSPLSQYHVMEWDVNSPRSGTSSVVAPLIDNKYYNIAKT